MKHLFRGPILAAAAVLASWAGAATLTVDVSATRSQSDLDSVILAQVKSFARQAAKLTNKERTLRRDRSQFTLPLRVVLTRNGVPLPYSGGRDAGDLTLVFETTTSRVFPTSYRTHLEDTFTKARPAMNALFGVPKSGGSVKVLNYDADIQDRYAVSGGYYVPNAPGGPEIRFPVYNSPVSASINFIHTLLLAYQRDAKYFSEAWTEGLVRGATMAVARTAGSLPNNPTSDEVEATLDSLYDASSTYDWNNQPGLGANPFIAPNLLNIPLPVGGSTGGPYLLRYQMAGTAWAKVLAEYPGFISELNKRFYASPAAFTTEAQLVGLGQTVINFLSGTASATVEGLSFAAWVERQTILDATRTGGVKALIQAFPITPDAGSSDFGAFGLILHATKTQTNGDEILLSGRSYPVYWGPDNLRFFVSTQDDITDVAGGYGSVAPNFPRTSFDGQIYRVVVDMPFQNQNARVILPAGAISTGQNTSGNVIYGTLSSFAPLTGSATYRVRVTWNGGSSETTAQNGAFGANPVDTTFTRAQPVTVTVLKVDGSVITTVGVRRVNKGFGPLCLDLRPSTVDTSYSMNRLVRLALYGLPLQPYRPEASALLGSGLTDTLAATWNSRLAKWDLFPEEGRLTQGLGLYHRSAVADTRTIKGRLSPNLPVTVSLQPGWNAVTSPSLSTYPTTSVEVAPGSEFFSTFAEAKGTILGPTMFRWVPDAGNPDTGTFQPAATFPSGEGVFVKCLRSEGAALAFLPIVAAPAALTRTAQSSIAPMSPFPQPTWEAKLTVTTAKGHRTWVQFGQLTGATRQADLKFDTELPPSFGGLQGRFQGAGVGFRDIRPIRTGEQWLLSVEGLVPGQDYTMNISFLSGRSALTIEDFTDRTRRSVPAGGFTVKFRASAATHKLRLWNGGTL